ncbi:DEAD/DEAH box helicase family protein [bacterium]|nr:DEAD/DEAH box helicase family protein [bacterium]
MSKRNIDSSQLDLTGTVAQLKTAICVPAIRSAIAEWRNIGYEGATDITKELLYFWFESDHKFPDGLPFRYHACQREAVETLIYVWEVAKTRKRWDLYGRFRYPTAVIPPVIHDDFARYCIKMATGSGKTIVMGLAIVWQYLNAAIGKEGEREQYADTFLIIAPNVIVNERLRKDEFEGGNIFKRFSMVPKHYDLFWDLNYYMRDDKERPEKEGTLLLTNIHRLYDKQDRKKTTEPDAMTGVLGDKPSEESSGMDINEFLRKNRKPVLILNDEAHHTHDDTSKWNKVIHNLHSEIGVSMQLDFTATPRYQKGQLFPWTISDYPLKQAIIDGIVKRPMKGIAHAEEVNVKDTVKRYQVYLTAGIERWKEYKEQLAPLKRKPVLFVMMNDTNEAKEVTDWLRKKYPDEFGGDKTQEIHTDLRGENAGEVSKKDLDNARKLVREIDNPDNSINAIVSVLMLREGWDVKGVTVVVGLRPYSSKADILPEQTIGRGLRLMFRGKGYNYIERVDVIGNKKFIEFVEDLEKEEDMEFESFELGKDKLHIVVIQPDSNKSQYDIGLPILTPLMTRKKSIADEIELLDVMTLKIPESLKIKKEGSGGKEFQYEGIDVITKDKLVERSYHVEQITNPQEIIGFYTELIASELRLPSHFATLYPKVRDFFESKAFGKTVDLTDQDVINAISESIAGAICVRAFKQALSPILVNREKPEISVPSRLLSTMEPFPWSAPTYKGLKCILNLVPCDNDFERSFASFLDNARDVMEFSKLPLSFGFSVEYQDDKGNMRHYYPDFVAIDKENTNWIIETKGLEDINVVRKDEAINFWCENATELTGNEWRYIRVNQSDLANFSPNTMADLVQYLSGFPSARE